MEHQRQQQEKKDNASKFKEPGLNSSTGIQPYVPQQQQQQQNQQIQHHQRQSSTGNSPPSYPSNVIDLPSKERFKELLYRIEKEYEILWEENQELKLKYGLISKPSPAPQLLISHMGMITNPNTPQPQPQIQSQSQSLQPHSHLQSQSQQQKTVQPSHSSSSSSSNKKQSKPQNESIYYEIFNNLGSGKTKISSKSKEKKQKSSTTQSSKSSKNNPSKRDGSHKWIRAREYLGHRDGIWDISASPWDLFQFATASFDRTARIWSVDGSKIPIVYTAHTGTVNSIRYHPNERFLCTASGDKTIHVIKLPNERNSHSGIKSPLPFHNKQNQQHNQQKQQQQQYQKNQHQYQQQSQQKPQHQQQQQQYQPYQQPHQQPHQQIPPSISPQQQSGSPVPQQPKTNTFLDDNSDIDSISSVNDNDFDYQPPQETGEKLKLWTPLLEKGTPPPQVIVDNRHHRHPSLTTQQHTSGFATSFEMENMENSAPNVQPFTPQSPSSFHGGDDFKIESAFSNPIVNTYNNNNNNNFNNNNNNNFNNNNNNKSINNNNNNKNNSKSHQITSTTNTSNYVGATIPEPTYITIRTPFLELKGHSAPVVAANWISSTSIFSSSWDNTVRWWSTESGKSISHVSVFPRGDKHRYKMTNATSNPSSSTNSLTSSTDGVVRVWDSRTPSACVESFNSGQESINTAIYTSDGCNIVTSSEDKTVRVYDIRQSKDCKTSIRCPYSINRVSVSGKGIIAIPQDDGRVSVYNIYGNRKGKMRDQYKYGHKCMATATAWSSDDSVIFSSGFDRKTISWACTELY
ncbi:hypothetical protein CYY_002651 [Polysphondylium violaceum]|uniref:WD repeat-containing protein 37 n=1 Tax=Polysphondylium violaceum TaxID=133409 RepID=A0A8J4V6P4_9MYCE|nr:hypothetical protein CYY_002651 [Polysphondylium violaceum]